MFRKIQSNSTTKKQTERQTEKTSVAFECFVWSYRVASSVNYARTDRVISDRYRDYFLFL